MSGVLDLLRQKGISTKRVAGTNGGEYASACPNCGDFSKPGSDRFRVWPEQNKGRGAYWCRGCEKSGDDIQFLIDFEGLNFKQACERLDRPFKSAAPYRSPVIPKSNSKKTWQPNLGPARPPDLWLEKAELFVSWAHEKLLASQKKLAWLKKRGINKRTVAQFRLGWNCGKDGNDLFRPRESWGLPTVYKKNKQKKRLWIPRGLVIPLLTDGRPTRIRIRREEGEPRYYILPGSAMNPMMLGPESRAFIVVESELDALLVYQAAGDQAGCVALGSSSSKPDAEVLEPLKSSAVVLLALDYDSAGTKALQWWFDQFPQAERWPVPEGKDPGEAYAAGVNIKEWICAGLPEGWNLGQSLLGSKKKEAEPVTKERADEAPSGIPPAVLELQALLKKSPVSIQTTPKRTFIRESQAWARENWGMSKRISQLVFFAPGVLEYIDKHPATVITGNNII